MSNQLLDVLYSHADESFIIYECLIFFTPTHTFALFTFEAVLRIESLMMHLHRHNVTLKVIGQTYVE